MIELSEDQPDQVRQIVRIHLPREEVFASSSRVNGKTRKFSDLDLMINAKHNLPWRMLAELRESFEASDLSITVDVVDWGNCSDRLWKIVAPELVRLV